MPCGHYGSKLEIVKLQSNDTSFHDLGGGAEIERPRDAILSLQAVGRRQSSVVCNIGGIRHQFRDTEKGLKPDSASDSPAVSDSLVQEHRSSI